MSEPGRPSDHDPNERMVAVISSAGRRVVPLRRIRKNEMRRLPGPAPHKALQAANGLGAKDCESGEPPSRERLADRLVKLARLRREEEEARARREAAPTYAISDAIPLERLGFMGLMLRPPLQVMPAARPPEPAAVLHPTEPANPAPDIAVLMAEYTLRVGAEAVQPIRAPALVPQSQVLSIPSPPPPAASKAATLGALDAEVLSALDPIKRMAAALQATAGPEFSLTVVPAAAPVMPVRPEPLPRASTVAEVPARTASAMVRSAPVTPVRSIARARAWPSFATGFAIALAFGAGLYIFLAGA